MTRERFSLQVFKSMTSGKFYQQMSERRFSEALKYFSLLILFVTTLLSVRFAFEILKGLSAFETWSREHLPEIMIEKGKVSTNVPEPWRKEEKDFVAIIDTTGKTAQIEEAYPQGILLTQNRLIIKQGPYETRNYDLSQVQSFRFDAEKVKRWRKVGQWLLPPLFSLFLFVYFWIGKLLQVIFFSGVSLLTNWIGRRGLSYSLLLTLGIYAITLPLLLAAALLLGGIQTHFFDMIYFSVYAAFLVSVVLQFHPQTDEMSEE